MPYPVGRILTDEERARQLDVRVAVPAEPQADHELIRHDDVVLEVVDKYYEWKGVGTFFSVVLLAVTATPIVISSLLLLRSTTAFTSGSSGGAIFFLCVVAFIGVPLLGFLLWLLSREIFTWSHYPVRFDRQRRRVSVRRTQRNADVLEVGWPEVFWHARHSRTKPLGAHTWFLAGHVMASDKKTVRETFSFGRSGSSPEELYPLWEYVRRFMQDRDAPLSTTGVVLPIDGRREGFWWGARMLIFVAPGNLALTVVLLPLLAPAAIFRWLAMATNRPPAWPWSVETAASGEGAHGGSRFSAHERIKVAAALFAGLAAAIALVLWLALLLR